MESIMEILKQIQRDLKEQKQEMKNIEESINNNINGKFTQIEEKTKELESKIDKQQDVIEQLERQLKKKNLIFFGVEETENNYSELRDLVYNIITKTLKLACQREEIDEVKRLGSKTGKTRPIVITVTSVGRKIDILKRKKLLEGSTIYIKEDFPKKVLEKRKQLQEELKREREAGNKVFLRYDKIITLEKNTKRNPEEDSTRTQKRYLSQSPENTDNLSKPSSSSVKQAPKKNKIGNITTYLRNNEPKN
ncbi:chromosome partition protein Smc-like [Helicoverpa armigera]|uniref:chromosome partition protein Smc-like n=1 Tax=Helicoverpa armigera TaxID=29058 RepID=UPI003083BFEF